MKRIALYGASLDPVTFGHLWVIKEASSLFDEVFVAVADNPDKKYSFSPSQRSAMLISALQEAGSYTNEIYYVLVPVY